MHNGLKTFFERGDIPTEEQFSDLIDSYLDSKQPSGEANRRFIIDADGDVHITTAAGVLEYSFSDVINNKFSLLKNEKVVKQIDLSVYVDDTNLARLVSSSVVINGTATFLRDDNSTFTVDFSSLLVNVNPENFVPYKGATSDLKLASYQLKFVTDDGEAGENQNIIDNFKIEMSRNGGKNLLFGSFIQTSNNSDTKK